MKPLIMIFLVAGFGAIANTARGAELAIDSLQSNVEVDVGSTIASFVGKLEKYQTAIECDPAIALPTKAEVSFNFADLKTGNKDRDDAMLKWLEYDSNPTASFYLTGWKQAGTTNIALGKLTIHGITVAVQMPVVVQHDDTAWNISGQTVFNYTDFKLPKIRKALVLTVSPKLKVKFHLVGKIVATK